MGKTLRVRRFRPLFVFVLIAVITASSAWAEPPKPVRDSVFYVASNGNDHWSGRLKRPAANHRDGPFRTFQAAINSLRKDRRLGRIKGPVSVYFMNGTYPLTQPIVLQPEDSGSPNAPVRFEAAPGAKPVFSGGRAITGWHHGKDGLWTAQIPEVAAGKWYFQQLFVNGKRRLRARLPSRGFYRMIGPAPPLGSTDRSRTAFIFKPGNIRRWHDLSDVQVVVFHSWETSRLRIQSIDQHNHIVTFTGPAAWPFGTWERDQRYYIDNVRAGLTKPGEWYLDRKTGILTYRPFPSENMRRAKVVAPVLPRLLELKGDPKDQSFVRYIQFKGLLFEYADWALEPQGHSDPQAAVTVPAVVTADGAHHCQITRCCIAHIGTYAIWLRRGCRDDVIQHNVLNDLGTGGVRIGETNQPADPADISSHNWVDNNQIYDSGYVYPAGVGIWVAQSNHNVISHNDIHDLDYDGISVGWNWNDAPNDCYDNLIEYNNIHHVMRGVLSDGGGIYCLGASHGSIIRANRIHDVFPYPNPPFCWGIYLDATTSGFRVEDNIVYNTLSGSLMAHNGAHENEMVNNIFAKSATDLIWPPVPGTHNIFQRNICVVTQGGLFLSWSAPNNPQTVSDYNLYYSIPPGAITFWKRSLSEWQAQGMDRHSIIANPQFYNLKRNDYRLKPDSPALKLGFKPIEIGRIGLYGSRRWVESAWRFRYPPTKLPPPPSPPKPLSVRDGFERTPVGSLPRNATVIGEAKSASIRVTDEVACHGRHCLKITDSVGLAHPWEPFFFYQPHFTQGTAEAQFDIEMGDGAIALIEWRDAATPYRAGPSLLIQNQKLAANGRPIMRLINHEWYHIAVRCGLGKRANGRYDLIITDPKGVVKRFQHLAVGSSRFNDLEWLGFASLATTRTVFYLDDVSIQRLRH